MKQSSFISSGHPQAQAENKQDVIRFKNLVRSGELFEGVLFQTERQILAPFIPWQRMCPWNKTGMDW